MQHGQNCGKKLKSKMPMRRIKKPKKVLEFEPTGERMGKEAVMGNTDQ